MSLEVNLAAVVAAIRNKFNSLSNAGSWTTLRLATDQTVSAVAAVAVPGLSFALLANKDYEVEGKFLLRSSVVTTGARIGVTVPTRLNDSAVTIRNPASASADVILHVASGATAGLNGNTGAAVINVSYLGAMDALLRAGPTPTGNFGITLASEIAASAITLRAGSFIRYRPLN